MARQWPGFSELWWHCWGRELTVSPAGLVHLEMDCFWGTFHDWVALAGTGPLLIILSSQLSDCWAVSPTLVFLELSHQVANFSELVANLASYYIRWKGSSSSPEGNLMKNRMTPGLSAAISGQAQWCTRTSRHSTLSLSQARPSVTEKSPLSCIRVIVSPYEWI